MFQLSIHKCQINLKLFSEQKKGVTNPETHLALLQTAACESEEESDVRYKLTITNIKLFLIYYFYNT